MLLLHVCLVLLGIGTIHANENCPATKYEGIQLRGQIMGFASTCATLETCCAVAQRLGASSLTYNTNSSNTPMDPSCRVFGQLEPAKSWDNCTSCTSFVTNATQPVPLPSTSPTTPVLLGPPNLPKFSWVPSSSDITDAQQHYSFGHAIGTEFSFIIQDRMVSDVYLQTNLIPFFHDSPTYDTFLAKNNATYPMYVLELQGIADGSQVPFETLFINQMSEEFSYFYKPSVNEAFQHNPQRCSDLAWISKEGRAYLVHNEDSGGGDMNHTALISAPQGVGSQGVPFTTYTYLGNTPTGAFGWNANDLLFTMNYVAPATGDLQGGLGRVFMARDLLTMASIEDGIAKITRYGLVAGHNYQLFDLKQQHMYNVEVANQGVFSIRQFQVGAPAYFHANTYQTLNIPQIGSNSSTHRDARAKIMLAEHPITSTNDMLNVIGDQHDASWPIYHDNLSHEKGEKADWTLCTLFVNPTLMELHIYTTNPIRNQPSDVIDLKTWFNTSK